MKIAKVIFSVLMGLAMAMVGITIIGFLVGGDEPEAVAAAPVVTAKPTFYVPTQGDVVKVTQTIIGATKEDLTRALDLFGAGDQVGLVKMMDAGRAGITDPVATARVIGMTAYLREVRIVGGELDGVSGWIVAEAVKEKVE